MKAYELQQMYEEAGRQTLAKLLEANDLPANCIKLEYGIARNIFYELRKTNESPLEATLALGISPLKQAAFVNTLANAIEMFKRMRVDNTTDFQYLQTDKETNDSFVDTYERHKMRRKLIPTKRLFYRITTSLYVIDKDTGTSVTITNEDQQVSIWDMQTEAHLRISEKILGKD